MALRLIIRERRTNTTKEDGIIMEYQNNQQNIFTAAPLTVAQLIGKINAQIKTIDAKIIGEVGEAKLGPTGHMYFFIKG